MNMKMLIAVSATLVLSACSAIEPPPEPSGERVPINHLISQWQPPQTSEATVLTPQEKQQALLEARKQQIQAAAAAQTTPVQRMSQAEPVAVQAVAVSETVKQEAKNKAPVTSKLTAIDESEQKKASLAKEVNAPRPANQIFEKVVPQKTSVNDAEKLTPITQANEHGVALTVRSFE